MTTHQDPEQIRRDIESTRHELSHNVNELGETVSPSNVAARQKAKMQSKASDWKDQIMGAAEDAKESVSSSTDDLGSSVRGVQQATRRKTQGNPLAVGAIALAAGWLVGSLLPASDKEREAAQMIQDKAQPLVDQGREELKTVGQEMGEHLKEPAQQAAEEIKDTAQQGAEHVKSEGQSATEDVKESAAQAKDNDPSSGQRHTQDDDRSSGQPAKDAFPQGPGTS